MPSNSFLTYNYLSRSRFYSQNLSCRRGDSNPHGLPHTALNRACLPIPPLRRFLNYFAESAVAGGAALGGTGSKRESSLGTMGKRAAGTDARFFCSCSTRLLAGPALPRFIKDKTIERSRNTAAKTVVTLLKKLAAPRPPKTAPMSPIPPKAPANPPPLLDCNKMTRVRAKQTTTKRKSKNPYILFPLSLIHTSDDFGKALRIQTRSPHQGTVDILLAQKRCGILRLDTPTILNSDLPTEI